MLTYYQRAASQPSKPSGNYSYNFSTKTISPAVSSSWKTSIPNATDTTPCWVTTIIFSGNTTTVAN